MTRKHRKLNSRKNPQPALSYESFCKKYFGNEDYTQMQRQFYSDYINSGLDFKDYAEITVTRSEPKTYYDWGWEDAKARKPAVKANIIKNQSDLSDYLLGYEAWLDYYERLKKKPKRKTR
jgi:hypothetical protein